jgi:hypothetical protein
MITLKELAYNLINVVRGGKISDDDKLSLRQVEFWIHTMRSKLIRQDLDKGRTVSDNIKQTLSCLEVVQVDLSTCCKVRTGCFGYRTKVRLPSPIELGKRDLITSVGPASVTEPRFTLIPYQRAAYSAQNAKSISTKVFFHDGYLYFINAPDGLELVSVDLVAEDPTDLAKYTSCSGDQCYTDESKYPISAYMVDTLNTLIIEAYLKIEASAKGDNTNDAKQDLS